MRPWIAAVCIVLAALGQPAQADDALILPAGMSRLYAVPVFASVASTFDAEGHRQAIPEGQGRLSSFNLGLAAERGLNRWLTAGVQWTPGLTLSSAFDYPVGDPAGRDRVHLNDSFDALAGVKIGVLGSPVRDPRRATGFRQSKRLRLALGLAVKFPVGSIDWEREARRFGEGRSYLAQAADKHVPAPVVGLHLDVVGWRSPGSEFFVDFYAQYIPYLSTVKYGDTSLARHLDPVHSALPFDARYDLYTEIEPRYDVWLIPRSLRAGVYLPMRTRFLPAPLLDGIAQGSNGYRTTITPTVSLLSPRFGCPVELRVGYQVSAAGRSALAANAITVVLRVMP